MTYYLKLALSQYFTFNARSTRSEFWYYALTVTIINILFSVLTGICLIGSSHVPTAMTTGHILALIVSALSASFSILLIIPGISLAVRRLHDTGRSGWWFLLPIVAFGLATVSFFFGASAIGIRTLLMIGFIILAMIFSIVLLVFYCLKSEAQDNKYGAYIADIRTQKKTIKQRALIYCSVFYIVVALLCLIYNYHEFGDKIQSNKSIMAASTSYINKAYSAMANANWNVNTVKQYISPGIAMNSADLTQQAAQLSAKLGAYKAIDAITITRIDDLGNNMWIRYIAKKVGQVDLTGAANVRAYVTMSFANGQVKLLTLLRKRNGQWSISHIGSGNLQSADRTFSLPTSVTVVKS